MNLADEIEKQLPRQLVEFMQEAGITAAGQGQKFYLVGGVVRDLLLGRKNHDLDLVAEADAVILGERLAEMNRARLTVHSRFRTVNLKWDGWSVDIATARSETYSRPGALPAVAPGSLDTDLFRRDFTVNAMAVELVPGAWGELFDPYDGQEDIVKKYIRILHENSFQDDATRIWRAVRYEQRLDLKIEPDTLRLLEQDIDYLDTISGDRVRHELELVLREEMPEKALRRAAELGVLAKLHPSLEGDDWLSERFITARNEAKFSAELYLALLCYRMSGEESEEFIKKYRLRKAQAQAVRDALALKGVTGGLSAAGITPSGIYNLLRGVSRPALEAFAIAAGSAKVKDNIRLYRDILRSVKPALTGKDLQKLGIKPGPQMKELLQKLLEARLDGRVKSRQGEEEMVRKVLD